MELVYQGAGAVVVEVDAFEPVEQALLYITAHVFDFTQQCPVAVGLDVPQDIIDQAEVAAQGVAGAWCRGFSGQ